MQSCVVSMPHNVIDLSDVKENIEILTNYIKKRGDRKPFPTLRFVLMRSLMSYNKAMSKTNVLGFRYNEEDLKNQVENYSTLKITKSARGQVVLFFTALIGISTTISYFVDIGFAFTDLLISAVVYAVLLFFIYRGHRWAIIGVMILWSLDKAYTIYYSVNMGSTPLTSIVFLILGLSICSMALQVENTRRRLTITK